MMLILRSVALLMVLVMPASPAAAQDGPRAAAKAGEAAHALQVYTDMVREAGNRPDFTSPQAMALLRTVFDTDRLAALPPPTSQDIEWLMDWSDAARNGYKQIFLFGVSPTQRPEEATIRRNLVDYEDQMTMAMNFTIRLEARSMDAIVLMLSELPKAKVTKIRLEGFRMSRSGGGEMVRGALLSVAQGMKIDNARIVMKAVNDTRATWSNAVLPDDRIQIIAVLKEIQNRISDGEVSDNAAALVTAFAEQL